MTPRERLRAAIQNGVPDRVPCALNLTRWTRHHHGCACPRHVLKAAEEFGLDPLVQYAAYTWQSVSNDYLYAPGSGYAYSANGLYGDLPEVRVELAVSNTPEHVTITRAFNTPGGRLHDVIQWARPDIGFGDGPNPHRVEPLVKELADLEALRFLYPPPRKDVLADIPICLEEMGARGLLAAVDCAHPGSWGLEPLGPEGMLVASATDPVLLAGVCRLGQDAHLRNLKGMLERGIEVVFDSWFQCGPSVGWSPQTYREVFLPLVQEAVDLAHEHGARYIYQDDGRMAAIIPLVVQAGVDAVSGLQPPETGDVVLSEIKQAFGDRVALLGGLDPIYTFDMGSPDRVRDAVRRAIREAGAGGGYVLSIAEALDPTKTAPESIRAAGRAARDFGVYGRDL